MFRKKIEFLLAHVKNVSSKYKNIKLFISMKELFPILSTSEWKWFFFFKKKKKQGPKMPENEKQGPKMPENE